MFANLSSPLPNTAHASLNLDDMIRITSKLTRILTEECALLGAMKIKETQPFQAEKRKLSQQLEAFQRVLAADDSIVRAADPEIRHQLLSLTDGLMDTVEENMRRTAVAQSINKNVMETLVSGIAEQQRLGIYGAQGQANAENMATLSVNLNEKA